MSDPAQVAAVNTALNLLGQEPVPDLEDGSLAASVAAVKLMRVIETSRLAVLRRHGWLCAMTYATLSPAVLPAAVSARYPTAFLVPGDSLRVWEIAGETFDPTQAGGWGVRWQIGTVETGDAAREVIRASSQVCGDAGTLSELSIAYVRSANWAALDLSLRDAVAYDAAARAAWSITGERGVANDVAKQAEIKLLQAMGVDGTEEGGQPPAAPSIPAMLRAMSR